jgi:hypothetical protein
MPGVELAETRRSGYSPVGMAESSPQSPVYSVAKRLIFPGVSLRSFAAFALNALVAGHRPAISSSFILPSSSLPFHRTQQLPFTFVCALCGKMGFVSA